MSVKVKICGITNLADALVVVQAGADALGFVFWQQSPRCISMETAARIVHELPPFIVKVGVFVDAPTDHIYRAIGECQLDLLQFHGEETPDYCVQFGLMSMKAFRIRDQGSLQLLPSYLTDAWLLDTFVPDKIGGTGKPFNWELAVQAREMGRPIFLAGGLTPENVSEAVRQVRPYAVDVSSGVEAVAGKKDHEKVRRFVEEARAVS